MKRIFTANTLKLIAIASMLIDHLAFCFVSEGSTLYFIMRFIGRITAPVMCYFIAEGYFHTHNLKKYMLRLLVFALISHFPYVLCLGLTKTVTTSVMLPLLMGLCALALYENNTMNKWLRLFSVIMCFVISIPCDWSCIPVFLVLLFGMYKSNKKEQLFRYTIFCVILAIIMIVDDISQAYMAGIVLAIPLLYLYSGELGKKSTVIKWSFYVFYPLHLLILYAVTTLIA